MRYIDSWLTGLGLEYIIPKLKANGITTPKKLALLTLRDMYEVVGVEDAEDRKKLYFLIQRLHTILSNKPETLASQDGENDDEEEEDVEEDDEHSDPTSALKRSPDRKGNRATKPSGDDSAKAFGDGGVGRSAEEDLRVLRRNKRTSIEPAPLVPLPPSPKLQIPNSFTDFSEGVPYEIKSARNSRKIDQKSEAVDALGGGMQDITLNDKPRQAQQSSRQMQPKKSFRTAAVEESPPSPPPVAAAVRVQSARGARLDSNQPVAANRRRPVSPPASPPHSPPPPLESRRRGVVPVPSAKATAMPTTNSNNTAKAAARSVPTAPPARATAVPDVEEQQEQQQDDEDDEYPIVDMAIRVVVRKRPMSRSELAKGDRDVMDIRRGGVVLVNEPKVKVDLTKVVETQAFTFDDAFDAAETNEAIYARTIKHLVSFVFDGGKASCFAYGQTGSGKTFSMMGSRPDAPAEATVNAGLYVLAARDIFSYVAQPKFKHIRILVSCFEIYGGKLFDLLNNRGVVKCLEDAKQQVQLPGLTEHQVRDSGELLDLMAMAHTQRSTGSTGANAESSRSHQVMQIVLRDGGAKPVVAARGGLSSHAPPPPRPPGGKLSFIDLAGSERGADTTHNSKQTRMEGAEINTSLLALKEVIRSLERKHGHTPFRGSKLTQVLKDSFVGEKTRTCMVACVSPSSSNCEHTLNTLRYADRVKEHQSGGPNGPGAHVDSHSKYDSMAYDYVPPPKTSAAAAAPAQQNSAAPSARGPAKSSGSSAAAAAPPSKLQPPSSKFAARSAQEADEAVQSRPLQRPAPGSRAVDPVSQRPMRSQSSSKIPSAPSEQRQQEAASRQQAIRAVPPRQPISRYEDEEADEASQDNGYSSDQEADAPAPVHSTKASAGTAAGGGGKRLSVGRSVDAQPSRQHYAEAESSSAYEEPPRRSVEKSAKPGARAQQDEQLRRRQEREYEADRREAYYRQSTVAGYAPPDDDEDEDAGPVFDGHRRVVGGAESNARRHSQEQRAEDNSAYEEEEEEEDIGEEEEGAVESTELIQKSVALLSAHKLSIAEMVEVMKEEMELVQEMENVDDRDAELYIDKLDDILAAKGRAVAALRDTLHRFQRYRAGGSGVPSSRRARPQAMPTSSKKRSEGKNGRL